MSAASSSNSASAMPPPPPPYLSQHRQSVNMIGTPTTTSTPSTSSSSATTPIPLFPAQHHQPPPPTTPSTPPPFAERVNRAHPTTPRELPITDEPRTRLISSESSSGGTPTLNPIPAPSGVDAVLQVNPVGGDDDDDDDDDGLEHGFEGAVPEMLRANTIERRVSMTAIQNDAAWRRLRSEIDELDADDIAPYFPSATGAPVTSEPRTLRASIVQRTIVDPSVAASKEKESEWDVSKIATRNASPSQSFLSSQEQALMTQLPKECTGASKLIMPAYLTGPISNVTLPSRLDLLGRRGFKLLGALVPRRVGNAVLGWSPVITTSWKKKEWRIQMQLFHLPFIFSKSMAKILLFLRFVALALIIIFFLDVCGAVEANPGRIWPIGIFLALVVMVRQSFYRRSPDGVMAFCRSMGVPEVEEYMFSYCWKVEPDNVRTLAKAVWKAGVGVWIDVVKLCPGDEIRPMVRTTVRRVHKVVIFLCQEYCASPNCCIEMMEAVQHPEKVTVCIIKNNVHPQIMRFLIGLKPRGLRMCVGFDELMCILDVDMSDMTDIAAFQWWRSQNISGAGVPDNLVPSNWPIARFSLKGRVLLPEKSVSVGPAYLSGDCKVTGQAFAPPWLLFIAIIGVGINIYDLVIDKYYHSNLLHSTVDYVFLAIIAACNCAPFIGFNYLLDRRRDCHVALRPLLASRAMGNEGIKVRIIGNENDPIYVALRQFLTTLGHLAPDQVLDSQGNVVTVDGRPEPRCVTVYVMESLARRDQLFGPNSIGKKLFDNRFSLFIWSGWKEPGIIPFTDDEIGQRLMRYLVLVVDWEKHGLCESLFSAIGVRVVDILHSRVDKEHRSSNIQSGRSTPTTSIGGFGAGVGFGVGVGSPHSLPPSLQQNVNYLQGVTEEAEEELNPSSSPIARRPNGISTR